MLYTRKGDDGTTKLFSAKGGPASGWGCNQRISKSSPVAEALGALDEINSLLGLVKVKSPSDTAAIIGEAQQNLFTIQAELAGADKKLAQEKVTVVEQIIDRIEKELPPITSFFVSGGTELAAFTDFARTVARQAERRVVACIAIADAEAGGVVVSAPALAYLNRLSSLLYALARLANHQAKIVEEKPTYS